jgi:hypothetical protein
MVLKFVVEDSFHSDTVATFPSRDEALAFVDRLRNDPEVEENRAPCTSWRTCRREYYLLDYDDQGRTPWTLLTREPLFAIDFETGQVSPIVVD